MTKLYRVVRKNDAGEWVPVRSYKAGARETVYDSFDRAARAMAGFKGNRYRANDEYRIEGTETQWVRAGA